MDKNILCPHCHHQHPNNVQYCPETGNPIIRYDQYCNVCGHGGQESEVYCRNCGNRLKPDMVGIYIKTALRLIGVIAVLVIGVVLIISFTREDPVYINESPEKITDGVLNIGIKPIALSPGGDLLALQSGGKLILYQVDSIQEFCRLGLTEHPVSVNFTPDSKNLVIMNPNGHWGVWSAENCDLIYINEERQGEVVAASVSPDGHRLISAYKNGSILVWDLVHGTIIQTFIVQGDLVTGIALSPDGELLAACSQDGTINIWNTVTKKIDYILSGSPAESHRLSFSPDSKKLVVYSPGIIEVWGENDGELYFRTEHTTGLMTTYENMHWNNQHVIFSPNSKYVICACDGYLMIWSISDGELVQKLELGNIATESVLISNNGNLLLIDRIDGRFGLNAYILDKSLGEPHGQLEIVQIPRKPTSTRPAEPEPVQDDLESSTDPENPDKETKRSTDTIIPTLTLTPIPSSTPFPMVTPIAVEINEIDGSELVLVPEGEFLMGSENEPDIDPYFYGAEGPQHMVYLDQFWIYRTEVTNGMYAKCVEVQKCPLPASYSSNTRDDYYGNSRFDEYPVVNVSWKNASAYCRWAGGRMPTEAEWEKAARGGDGRLFAWGNETPNSNLANYLSSDTVMVGSYPQGSSPYGVYDMSGNVIEWVFDYFQSIYYQVSPYENPRGPASSDTRVYRSGSYHNSDEAIRVVMRGSREESHTGPDIGFRCVIDLP